MAALVVGELSFVSLSGPTNDYITDRFNHVWGVVALLAFAAIVGLVQFVGDPIHCWCPAEFTDSHCNYTEAYCWVQDTYFIPSDEPVPFNAEERYEEKVKYYQWVPMILLFLAACFKIPHIIWSMLNSVTGVNIEKAVNVAEQSVLALNTSRNDQIKFLANYLYRWLEISRKSSYGITFRFFETISSFMCFCVGHRTLSYITGLYIFIKFLYASVAIGLLFALNHMLAMEYLFYGWEVIDNLVKGTDMEDSPRFPRITMCDFKIRQLTNIQTFSVQCVLSVNLFNEKIFIFIWFLLVTLSICNAFSWILALKNFALPYSRHKWIKSHMRAMKIKTTSKAINEKFERHLGNDGVFILRLIEDSTSSIATSDLLCEIHRLFCQSTKITADENTHPY